MLFDFDSIKTEIKYRLSLLSNWNTTLFFGAYERIVDAIAYITQKMIYVAEIFYREACLKTAQKIKSLAQIVWMLSYKPYRKVGAIGYVDISADPTFSPSYVNTGNNVIFPKWTRFTNTAKTSNVFSYEATTYYKNTIGVLQIPVKEGIPKEFTHTAAGTVSEKINVYSDSADNNIVDIYIVDENGDITANVTTVDDIYFVNDLVNYNCQIDTMDDFLGFILTFGDGITSRQLIANERVLIKYAETLGDVGNIESTGVINVINDTIYDVNGNVVTNLYVTNSEAISDGTSYEDIESIRNNSRHLYGAGYRCGTLTDWVSILESISYIYKATVWTINDVGGSTLLSEQNRVYIAALTASGDDLTSTQKTDVSTLLYADFASPTEVIDFQAIQKIYPVFDVNAKIRNKTALVVEGEIKDLIEATYSTLNTDFMQKIYQSNFIGLLNSITDIVYHNTTIQLMEYNLNYVEINKAFFAYHTSTILEDQVNITVNTPQLWIKRKVANVWQVPLQIAYSSGSSFIGMNGYSLSSTNVDYVNNQISYIIDTILNNPGTYGVRNPGSTDPLGYIISLIYSTQDGNAEQTQTLRLYQRYQITEVDTDYIFTNLF